MKQKIIFMGTPDFAVPSLCELIEKHDVCAVFTQPDKPKGRGQKLQFTPVKEIAVKNNIPVYQPLKLRGNQEAIGVISSIQPDLIVVIAYGQLLPPAILEIPKLGCINLHASLLPELRGAAPINWAIINGFKKTGNTTMLMAQGLDTGDMLMKSEISIEESDTAGTLHDKLSLNGVELLLSTIDKLANGELVPEKQNDELSSYASMLTKELGHIKWSNDCDSVYNLIRGVHPWPGAYSFYKDGVIKFHRIEKNMDNSQYTNPGEIISVSKKGIVVACTNGSIIIKELQESTGKRMDVAAYINGHDINIGDMFL